MPETWAATPQATGETWRAARGGPAPTVAPDRLPGPVPGTLSGPSQRYYKREIRSAFAHPKRALPPPVMMGALPPPPFVNAGLTPISWWEAHVRAPLENWARYQIPAFQRLSAVADMPLSMAYSAMMAQPGARWKAAKETEEAGRDISFGQFAQAMYKKHPTGPLSYVFAGPATVPAQAGVLDFGLQALNPAWWGGGELVGGARAVLSPAVKAATKAALRTKPGLAVADVLSPLHSLAPEQARAALRLAQETQATGPWASATVRKILRGVDPKDFETLTHIVQGLTPEAPIQNQFIAANARITRPDLYAKAEQIERATFAAGTVKSKVLAPPTRFGKPLPNQPIQGPYQKIPRRGYLPGMLPPAAEREAERTSGLPVRQRPSLERRSGTGTGGRVFTIDPRSAKAKHYGSALEREQAGLPTETDVSRLLYKTLVSARRYETFNDYADELRRIGALQEPVYYDPRNPGLGPMTARQYARYARSSAREQSLAKYPLSKDLEAKSLAARQQTGKRIVDELTKHLKPEGKSYAVGALLAQKTREVAAVTDLRPANMEAYQMLRRREAQDIARSIMSRREREVAAGHEPLGASKHLPEQLRNTTAARSLARFTNRMSGATPEQAVGVLGDIFDKWTAGVRAGIIANMWYHPLFNLMPQYENAAGRYGGSAAALVVKYSNDLTRFLSKSVQEPVSLYEVAGPDLRAKLDFAREQGALPAIGGRQDPKLLLSKGLRGKVARGWDLNQRVTFGMDDFFAANLADEYRRAGMPYAEIGRAVRNALGRYGPAFNTSVGLNRLFLFWPWMSTMASYWLGGKGFENLRPIGAMHGFAQSYNQVAGTPSNQPLEIGGTMLPQSYGFALRAMNAPASLIGWGSGHLNPTLDIPMDVALNKVAPFSPSSTYLSGQIKPDLRVRTPGAPAWYQALEIGRHVLETGVPGGSQLVNFIQGLKNQGFAGAIKSAAGLRTYGKYDPIYARQMAVLDDALQHRAISFSQYLKYAALAKKMSEESASAVRPSLRRGP